MVNGTAIISAQQCKPVFVLIEITDRYVATDVNETRQCRETYESRPAFVTLVQMMYFGDRCVEELASMITRSAKKNAFELAARFQHFC